MGDTGLKVADGIVANVGRKPSAIFTIQNHGSGVVSFNDLRTSPQTFLPIQQAEPLPAGTNEWSNQDNK